MAHDQQSFGRQDALKGVEQRLTCSGVQVNEKVAAENDVKARLARQHAGF